jgi:4-amino-4-deoxy-L-arabinose transferase-like glycosyltransferase
MHPTPEARGGRSGFWLGLLVLALLTALTLYLQIRNNAFGAELGDDEASHYISGLLIRDYLLSGLPQSPIAYLANYHAHYPLIGIGHWGPAYYLVEGLWMLVLPPTIQAAIGLSTVFTVATAAVIYVYGVRKLQLGPILAAGAAALFVITPLVQSGSSTIMLDVPVAFLTICAAYAYTQYLETESPWASAAFGLFAVAAILTKGNGALLALTPPLAVLATRRWDLLRRWSFWLPAGIVVVLAGPWYLVTYGQVSAGFRYAWGTAYSWVATVENTKILIRDLSAPVLILAVLGVVAAVRERAAPVRTAALMLIVLTASVWIFQTIVPAAIQDRYLAPLIPPVVLLAALGGRFLVARWSGPARVGASAVVAAVLLVATLPAALAIEPRPTLGIRRMAQLVWAEKPPANPVVLISAKASLEAAAIAELAQVDPRRPSLFAVRGSRLLGGGGYNRTDYVPKYATTGEVAGEIEQMRVPLVLYQDDPGGWRHVAQVEQVREAARPSWRLLGRAGTAASPISLYALPDAVSAPADFDAWVAMTRPRQLQ